MKKKFLLLSGIVVLSFSAKAQELRENYMVWPDSKGIADYVTKWTPGTPLFEDENFYISRVKPKKRFRNSATQINESLTEANDRKLVFWVPIGQVTGGNVNARPDGEFDSEVFSTWSYVTHYGDWTSPHGWVPGGFADVAHKNGVGVSGVASIPNSGISTSDGAWGQALHKQVILDNEKFAKFLHYHGVDGLGYNSEFSGMSDDLPALHTQHELIHKYLVEQGNHLAENFWYDGTNDTGGITWDGGISSHNKETFGNGDHIRTSLFLNYNWWRSQVLSSISNIQNVAPGRSSLDLYAGFNMQGGNPSTWTTLAQYPMSIGLWGAHDYNMLWAGRSKEGSADISKQSTYQNILEMFFTNGNRNPVKKIDIYDAKSHFPNEKWFGMSAYISARSSLSWDLSEEPFITFFNLGNGRFFNWKGERQNDNEWYNIGVQDYLPTWRYWFASSFMGKEESDVPADGLDAQFTWDDAYVGGSCLRIFGSTDNEYLHLFKTDFLLNKGDVITVRYKLMRGQADINLVLSAKGKESTILRENNLKVLTTKEVADDEIWVQKTFKISGLLASLDGQEAAMIGLHFKNAENLEFYLGEFSITRSTTPTPSAPEITVAKAVGSHLKGVDAKVIFNMPNNKEAGTPVYNLDVNTSMFKLYAQQEGGEPVFMGITTSWAGMYYSIPIDANKAQRIRLGVAAVSVDTNSDSEIAWSEYTDDFGDYSTINDIQIDKTTIKPEENFEISYVDPRHNPATWKLYNGEGEVVKEASNTIKFSVPEGIKELGAYDLEITESDTLRRINSYVQITSWGSGALPEIKSLTLNGEDVQEGASPVKIEIGEEITLGYTGRKANGAASRGISINEASVGCKMKPLGIDAFESFSISTWINFTSVPGSSVLCSIEDRTGSWPVNNWGWFWSNIDPDGTINSFSFRASNNNGAPEYRTTFPESTIIFGAWTHLALIFEYNDVGKFRVKLYINGVLQKSTWTYNNGAETGTTEDWCSIHFALPVDYWMCFGGGRGNNPTFNNGVVDELQVWKGAMTPEEVKLSKAGLDANNLPENVLAYWDFDTDADNDHYFTAKGSKPETKACNYKIAAGDKEGSGTQTPQLPIFLPGTPYIAGSAYKIETLPTWTAKRAVISEATGNDIAGNAKLSYEKASDRTVTLTLANDLGSDSRDYPVFSIYDATGVESMDATGEPRTYTVEDILFVEFAEDGNYQVSVYTISGMLAAQKAEILYAGQNMRITLGTNGIYLVKVIKDGKEVRTIKILKK